MLRWAETLVQLHQNKRLALLLAEARHLVEARIVQNIHAAALRLGRLEITHYCSRRCSGEAVLLVVDQARRQVNEAGPVAAYLPLIYCVAARRPG